jgi:hypothetical protein
MSGELRKAETCANEALTLSQSYDQRDFEGVSMIWVGRILGKEKSRRGGQADGYIMQGIKVFDELGLKPWSAQGHLFLGDLYVINGMREKALANLRKAEAMFQEMGMDYWLDKTQEMLERL